MANIHTSEFAAASARQTLVLQEPALAAAGNILHNDNLSSSTITASRLLLLLTMH